MAKATKNAFVIEAENRMKREKAKNMRYKKPIAKGLNIDDIRNDLYEMQEAAGECRWFIEDGAGYDALYMVMDGDEDDLYEFKMAFSDLEYALNRFYEDLSSFDRFGYEWQDGNETDDELFDLLMVGSVSCGQLLGYDEYEEDYYGLSRFEGGLAQDAAQKNLMRLTKQQMIEAFHKASAILISYLGLKYRYDCLKASMDILRDQNESVIKIVKEIEAMYDEVTAESGSWMDEHSLAKGWDKLLETLPADTWLA